ncbi:hypothetical protein PRUPE_6G188600 [Prunus persica]|uniref:Uncharacterized protein n=1 Tax=Prunus persica TaxID=3760 RepID=A0A251NSJ2_PRUPE|nr:hypothetical protein PRUPE_6G188600 [Prunus persica]
MSVSLEALAMAGKDYLSIAMTVEEWERLELSPPHLLAEDEEEKDERNLGEQVMGKETKKGREGGGQTKPAITVRIGQIDVYPYQIEPLSSPLDHKEQ